MKKFSDLATQSMLSGDKINVADILGKKLVILSYRIGPSKQDIGKRCLTLQFEYEGKTRVIFTGSEVLMRELERLNLAEDFPFEACIIKEQGGSKSWFKFTDPQEELTI